MPELMALESLKEVHSNEIDAKDISDLVVCRIS
jgi:hypothetical protein